MSALRLIIVVRVFGPKKTTLNEYEPSDQSLSTLNHSKNDKECT